jgi:hypothetical protein
MVPAANGLMVFLDKDQALLRLDKVDDGALLFSAVS